MGNLAPQLISGMTKIVARRDFLSSIMRVAITAGTVARERAGAVTVAAALSVGTGAVAVGRAALLGVEAAAGAVIYFFCMAFCRPSGDTFSRTFLVFFHNSFYHLRFTIYQPLSVGRY